MSGPIAGPLGRGEFAQALMAKGITHDSRKDGLIWALRYFAEPDDDGVTRYADLPLDCSTRESTVNEAVLYGKAAITGGFKITVPGAITLRQTPFNTQVVDIAEDSVLVRGDALDDSGDRPCVTDPEFFDIVHVERLMHEGNATEFWLFVQPANGGPTRG